MKPATTLAALIVATTAFTALPAMAQTTSGDTIQIHDRSARDTHRMVIREGRGAGNGLLRLVCSERGAEALEIQFVRLSHRLDLTDQQTPLFDALRTSALTAQTSFADTCADNMPERTAGTAPDLLDGIKARLAIDEARLAAFNEVLPEFEALYTSLSDEQKAALAPRMMRDQDRSRGDRSHRSERGDRPDRSERPDRSDRPMRAPAPGR